MKILIFYGLEINIFFPSLLKLYTPLNIHAGY